MKTLFLLELAKLKYMECLNSAYRHQQIDSDLDFWTEMKNQLEIKLSEELQEMVRESASMTVEHFSAVFNLKDDAGRIHEALKGIHASMEEMNELF